MRVGKFFVKVGVGAVLGIGGIGVAHAVTFDGQDPAPEWTAGITEVSAVATDGTPVLLPVWSLDACPWEDGSARVGDCIWVGSQRGNGIGASVAYVGGLEIYLTNYAGEILVKPEQAREAMWEQPGQPTGMIVPDAPVVDVTGGVMDGGAPFSEDGLAPCVYEDSVNCYWDAQKFGNGIGQSFTVDAYGNYTYL